MSESVEHYASWKTLGPMWWRAIVVNRQETRGYIGTRQEATKNLQMQLRKRHIQVREDTDKTKRQS
nr:uncharacterized protein CTRU02_11852 [Colletotrichum truncatum]KAF6785227.1 hypothetical protein CTRU02_11852 [Colletotrichum truncatum]